VPSAALILYCTASLPVRCSCLSHNSYWLGLRSASSYLKPRLHTKLGERVFSFCGPAEWNCLPRELQMITDTTSFLKKLKAPFIIEHSVLTNSRCFSFSSISITYHFSSFYCNALLDLVRHYQILNVCMYVLIIKFQERVV